PMTRIKMGLRIIGKENLRKHKDELKGGAVTVSNHVHMWDYLALRCALKKKDMAVLCWKKNVSGETGALVRLVGGIPIPEGDIKATHAFKKATDEFLNGGYVQIYAEGSMWEYYRPIRPFRTGAALFAIDNDKPVLPMAFSYRKPSFLRKMFGQWATFTLNIGEPLYANPDLEKKEAQMDLTKRLHDEVCRLAGIDPEKNIYKPIFDNDTRIDYYDALRQ
ncbi:MAG: 1-acyl-sn-glycerol-3-phosphate acyltransferase, partial [Bacilli bacterium]|nr:1-acyl-sn-glycerol-3-phosphate acyltransferase [Bacilli bacterium]